MEMLWYLKPGEPPKSEIILTRMSEGDVCLISGETDPMAIPVDMNTSNMLPSNMINLSKNIIEGITHTINYKHTFPYGISVVLNTPPCLMEYNKNLLTALEDQIPEPLHYNFIEIYELLMTRHVKGISKIEFENSHSYMDWAQLQRYWFSQLDKVKNKKLKIITSVN